MRATSMIPTLSYNDAPAAIAWLCKTFGFEKQLVVPDEHGQIAHAELVMGRCMIMIGSANNGSEFNKHTVSPADIGNKVTQSAYVVLDDEDMKYHYENAKDNGAVIAIDLKTEDYGGQGYSCFDLEGHLWTFGSYDPWLTL